MSEKILISNFNRAWDWRENLGLLKINGAVRVFHGAGEGRGDEKFFAIDRFGEHYWITEWEFSVSKGRLVAVREKIIQFLSTKGAVSVVGLVRPEKGAPNEAQIFFGKPNITGEPRRIQIQEGPCQFWIQLDRTRHPGLFLDQAPLRKWLFESMRGKTVLNTFAYTGSLSVAAALGDAEKVTTLDLSQPSLQWAKENMELNKVDPARLEFIHGDTFEWLPRLKKSKKQFDCVILDPPSFSHGHKGSFSTQKDLPKLHTQALELVKEGGYLVTSINSANIPWKKFESDIIGAAQKLGVELLVLRQITLPETFPTLLTGDETRYLKGWIFRKNNI